MKRAPFRLTSRSQSTCWFLYSPWLDLTFSLKVIKLKWTLPILKPKSFIRLFILDDLVLIYQSLDLHVVVGNEELGHISIGLAWSKTVWKTVYSFSSLLVIPFSNFFYRRNLKFALGKSISYLRNFCLELPVIRNLSRIILQIEQSICRRNFKIFLSL